MAIKFERDDARNQFVVGTESGYRVKLSPLASAQEIRDARRLVEENERHARQQINKQETK